MSPKKTGEFISLLRKENNMTQKQLADKMNISNKAISRWETGRGYPDIESLLALSREFSVSINELLYGTRIETTMEKAAEKDIANAYMKIVVKKKSISILAIGLAVILIFVIAFSALSFSILYEGAMGSENCVIARDYSYLTLFDQRYVPLVLNDAECMLSEPLIGEARVEDSFFVEKLLFGETVYSLKRCINNEIVYLQTDYDYVESNYYCLENKVEEYKEMAQDTEYNMLTAEIIAKDGNVSDIELNGNLAKMIRNSNYKLSAEVNCDWSRGQGDESITIYASQTEGPFRKKEGELIRKQGEYYWFDYDDIPTTQNNGDFSRIIAYEIDNRYDENLDELFSYMFK